VLPIRWRLTLFNAICLLVIAILLSIGLFAVMGVSVQDIVENSTRQRADEAARILGETGGFADLENESFADRNVSLVAFDSSGAIVYRQGPESAVLEGYPGQLAFETLRDAKAIGAVYGFDTSDYEADPQLRETIDESYVYAVPAPENDLGISVIAASRSYDAVGGGRFGEWVVGGMGLLLFLLIASVVASYLVTKAALRPIDRFVASAEAMSESDLSRRLPQGSGKRNELDRLAQTFNGLLARLQAAFQDREIALEEQRQFTQDASHELRTPLTSILGYTRMLKTWGLDDPETTREAIDAIGKEAERMHGLVERLLTLAKGDADAFLNLQDVDLRDVVRPAVESVDAAQDGKVAIEVSLPEDPVVLAVEPDLVTQAVVILLDNAVKFTPKGGLVQVRLSATADGARVMVRDTGSGISQHDLPRIFDRFYRSEVSRSQPGSGLGLAIARQIAERHGGRIEVVSVVGEGSTFTLILPIEMADRDDPASTIQTGTAEHSPSSHRPGDHPRLQSAGPEAMDWPVSRAR
jgi:signal transduction histidine kinase